MILAMAPTLINHPHSSSLLLHLHSNFTTSSPRFRFLPVHTPFSTISSTQSSTISHNCSSRSRRAAWLSAAFSSHTISDEANSSSDKDAESARNGGRLQEQAPLQQAGRVRKAADTTDWVASALSRRFGLGAGLAWVGFLAFGVISEQLKTRLEVFNERQGTRDVENATETVLPNKVRFVDLRVGGGSSPKIGDLVVVNLIGKVQRTGQVFVDTFSGSRRPLAFVFGARPYSRGMCEGLEFAMQSMKVGGKRKVVVPSDLGFGKVELTLVKDKMYQQGLHLNTL
ncbi:hypothetical protein O6H91_05G038100 [Diphasiastrum complanatum]|uniref:Uncharacterized protein n=1 Tax=Diphasiastrum complanatum TaxID=34168 RepID=A0ACC2DMP4_DIPCM|nr:hypothetical protein O6H91_05G038100 [Diphasiastrum complanatum]